MVPGEDMIVAISKGRAMGEQWLRGSEMLHKPRTLARSTGTSRGQVSQDVAGSSVEGNVSDKGARSTWEKMYSTTADGWLHRPATRPHASVNLFCFSHAGGTASTFRLWPAGLPAWLEVWAVQLPGRGSRWRERPIPTIPALVDAFIPVLLPHLRRPFAFFGHSMGAVLANEIARTLTEREAIVPRHLFVSSRRPPHMPASETNMHTLPDDELIKQINLRYGGVPRELLHSTDILALLIPALRADIAALETFQPSKGAALPFPISAFGGVRDPLVPRSHLEAWRSQTDGPFRVHMFPGGHFYMDSQRDALLAELSATLAPILHGPRQTAEIA
jgi:medium-chain acyl-[acyl-carrier-protein] hydrolase